MDDSDLLLIAIVFATFGAFILGTLYNNVGNRGEIKELGQLVCDEMFDMDFKSYDNKEIKCKEKDVTFHIKGIKVNLGKYNKGYMRVR